MPPERAARGKQQVAYEPVSGIEVFLGNNKTKIKSNKLMNMLL